MLGKKHYGTGCILTLICLVQLCVFGYFGGQKSFLMCDELFTYTSSNNAEIQAFDMPLNEWLDREWYLSQGAAMEGHTFEYAIPYRNQEADVHPPIYYFLMHTLCSLVPGKIVFGLGVGLNIFFMLGCTVLLYLLAKEIFKNTRIGILVSALFGVTYGACNMVLFVRMYTIVAFFLAAWYFVKLWLEKRFREECYFHVIIEVSALICLAIFPAMWNHIFNDYRGEAARKSFVQLGGFAGRLRSMLRFLDEQLFNGCLLFLMTAALLLIIIYFVRHKCFPWKELERLFPILFMTVGYFALVTKIAPFITDRYLMPIYPFVYLIAVGGLCWLLGKFIREKAAIAICMAALAILSAGSLSKGAPEYAYTNFEPHRRKAEEYSDRYCVYIDREYDWWEYYDVIQLLKEYKGFYCISYAAITDDIKAGMEALEGQQDVIVYVGNSELDEEITAYIQVTVGAEEMTV